MVIPSLISRVVCFVSGVLYPAYGSFKAINANNSDENLKWMIYWIVYAVFCATEAFTDIFLCWFPFYYDMKIVLILWMLPSMTNGSAVVYHSIIGPMLQLKEPSIDEFLCRLRSTGNASVIKLVKRCYYHAHSYIKKTMLGNDNNNEQRTEDSPANSSKGRKRNKIPVKYSLRSAISKPNDNH